jgi:hypothetical protein
MFVAPHGIVPSMSRQKDRGSLVDSDVTNRLRSPKGSRSVSVWLIRLRPCEDQALVFA